MRRFSALLFSLVWVGCIPTNRIYKDGAIVSKEFSIKKPTNAKPTAQGVEHTFLLGYQTTGILKKNAAPGIEKEAQAPVALQIYCPSQNGTIRTYTVFAHAIIPIFIWPLIWAPVYTEVYCAPADTATSTSSPASQASSTPSKEEEAERVFREAEVQFRLLKYQEALAGYQEAYVLSQKPEILFNIAQCYRLLERYDEALATYQSFLRDAPNTPMRADVERLMEETKKQQKKSPKK